LSTDFDNAVGDLVHASGNLIMKARLVGESQTSDGWIHIGPKTWNVMKSLLNEMEDARKRMDEAQKLAKMDAIFSDIEKMLK
jgi:hypothetical protein